MVRDFLMPMERVVDIPMERVDPIFYDLIL